MMNSTSLPSAGSIATAIDADGPSGPNDLAGVTGGRVAGKAFQRKM